MKHRCINCAKLTEKWQRVNGGHYHCYDGCKSTTGFDHRQPVSGNWQVLSEGTR